MSPPEPRSRPLARGGWAGLALALLACRQGPAESGSPPPRAPLAPELRPAASALEARRFAEARTLAQAYLDRHPRDGQALFLLGLSHYWSENYGAARPLLEQALEAEPQQYFVHDFLGHSLFLLGELEAARREYEAYLAVVPREPKGHYGLGLIELEETRLEAAAGRFRHALELFAELGRSDPRQLAARQGELAECHARLGDVHFARGEYAAARAELLRATSLSAGAVSAFYTLSLVHRRLGEQELAEQALARYEAARQALIAGQGSSAR